MTMMVIMMQASLCLINSRDQGCEQKVSVCRPFGSAPPTYQEKDEHKLDMKTIMDPQQELHLIKVASIFMRGDKKSFYVHTFDLSFS